jgi:nucleotide-binding universal stress UspA family protein
LLPNAGGGTFADAGPVSQPNARWLAPGICQEKDMDRIANIVVGVDFSAPSKNALAEAMRIARWNKSAIRVVHVIESGFVHDVAEAYGVSQSEFRSNVVGEAKQRANEFIGAAHNLNVLMAQAKVAQVEASLDIRVGNPQTELLRSVEEASADLLVLGASGWSDPKRGPGVLAMKCLRRAGTDVMLVREFIPAAFTRVMCCIDFSDTCRLAVEQAARIARQDKAELILVYAFTPPWEVLQYSASMPEASPTFQQEYRNQLHSRLDQFVSDLSSVTSGVKVESHVTESVESKTGLVDFVRSSGADLVVVGTKGCAKTEGVLLGRTAERLVRESPCSILAIKPKSSAADAA